MLAESAKDWRRPGATGAKQNRNQFGREKTQGSSWTVPESIPKRRVGTIADRSSQRAVTYRTAWDPDRWGNSMLSRDASADGQVDERSPTAATCPWPRWQWRWRSRVRSGNRLPSHLAFPQPSDLDARGETRGQTRIGNYYTATRTPGTRGEQEPSGIGTKNAAIRANLPPARCRTPVGSGAV